MLLDSIYREMPIGSLFRWEMDRKSAHLIRQSAEVLPSFNSAHKHIWFVIDGQQRLSVIHQAFEAQKKKNDAGKEIDFERLCFVPVMPQGPENPPRVVYRKPSGKTFVPVRDILAPQWKQRMPSKAKSFLKRIGDCRKRLLDYPIPVVIVRSATLDEIGDVFIRVNSQGMRVTSADRAVALMGEPDVRAMADELRQKIRDSGFYFGDISPILMGLSLVDETPALDGDPPRLDVMARRWSKKITNDDDGKEEFRHLWDKYQRALSKAVDYLRAYFPVHDESYLPSMNMLATLSVFFFHHPGQPTARQKAEIRKWFWATGVAQRYSGRGYHRNIAADANFFTGLARGSRKRFIFTDLVEPAAIQNREYASNSARTRAFFCLLAERQQRNLETGDLIPLDKPVISHTNTKHRHHIFPRQQLINAGIHARVYNGLCNMCFLMCEENVRIGKELPKTYLARYRAGNAPQFSKVMKSHLVPAGPNTSVWKRGVRAAFRDFRKERLPLICSEFEKAAGGMKLFSKPV